MMRSSGGQVRAQDSIAQSDFGSLDACRRQWNGQQEMQDIGMVGVENRPWAVAGADACSDQSLIFCRQMSLL